MFKIHIHNSLKNTLIRDTAAVVSYHLLLQMQITNKLHLQMIKLIINEEKTIKIYARQYYSKLFLQVEEGEKYSFRVVQKDKWIDFLIPSTTDGFDNKLLKDSKKRLPGAKCFKLCGTIGKNEENHFAIGSELSDFRIKTSGKLYFFANDHRNNFFYLNNFGSINLLIRRIQ